MYKENTNRQWTKFKMAVTMPLTTLSRDNIREGKIIGLQCVHGNNKLIKINSCAEKN